MRKKILANLKALAQQLKHDEKAMSLWRELADYVDEMDWPEKELGQSTALPLPEDFVKEGGYLAIFADGGCKGNPGPGAWAAIGQRADASLFFELTGVDLNTTNNKMELEGTIQALQQVLSYLDQPQVAEKIYFYTDSKYVVEGLNRWLAGWKSRGWRKADGKEILNLAQWQELASLLEKFSNLKISWVRGHAGHPQNERCDQMANQALQDMGFA